MKRGEILDAVKKTITQDRNNRHGEPENSFPRIAEAWTDYLIRRGWTPGPGALKPSDVAEMLAIFKGVRFEIQPDNPDNEHDRIGYYAIAAELRETEREERVKVKDVIAHYEDKVAELAAAESAHPQTKAPMPVEYPPHMPKSHGELCYHKNNEFVANWDGPKGLIWAYVRRY